MLNPNEVVVLVSLLDSYDDQLACAGCNDFELDDTPENRTLVKAAQRWRDPDDTELQSSGGGKIMTQDSLLVGYLRDLLLEGKP